MSSLESDRKLVCALRDWSGKSIARISKEAGFTNNTTLNRHANGSATTRLGRVTIEKLQAAFPTFPGWDEDLSESADYVDVIVLPSFGGMGGGGNGEGERVLAKLSRRLIEEDLRGRPVDFLLIDVRGDSMTPDFQHGDQILVDKRDVDPVQPGPFAMWDGEAYVVKLVERVPRQPGRYRVFSANGRYSEYEVDAEEAMIMGRPVWFARRL